MNETVSVNNRIFLRLALAYLFCNMNFHIGPINLLPEFVGYLFLLSVFRNMADVRPEIQRLNGFVYFLLTMSIVSPVLNFLTNGAVQSNTIIPLPIISTMMSLYVWFVVFTIYAQYCADFGLSTKSIYRIRNGSLVLTVAMFILLSYLMEGSILLWILIPAQFILIIWFARVQMLLSDELAELRKEENQKMDAIKEEIV